MRTKDATFKPGNHVAWGSSQGEVKGTVEKKRTTPTRVPSGRVSESEQAASRLQSARLPRPCSFGLTKTRPFDTMRSAEAGIQSGAWRSLVACLNGVQKVAGSNPVAPIGKGSITVVVGPFDLLIVAGMIVRARVCFPMSLRFQKDARPGSDAPDLALSKDGQV